MRVYFDCRSPSRKAIWNTFSPREQQSHIAYHWNKTLLKSLKAAFRIKLKPDREICLHFEMQNAKPLETTIIGEWILEVSLKLKKKKYLEVKRRKLKQPKLLQFSVLGSGPPAAKNRHGKNRNCTDWRKPRSWAQCSRARTLQPLAPHR